MELGAFSVSLNVSDITASKTFYEKLGFHIFGGDISQHWLIMKNNSCGIKFQTEADEGSSGPASYIIVDPDGNPILVDQHV